jgi:mitochondrial import receptor subunit TOM40|eukprot:TRINITY_DN76596_c0_g1_i1.p1 TRINITY_DN76596_c0_g1~~TRINITY_DN76596_c0_g1_i1.p1  ORF type:complete len:359 (-),score=58.43 TRINITY_DN76596_c0_g1_i1:189-1265(-)
MADASMEPLAAAEVRVAASRRGPRGGWRQFFKPILQRAPVKAEELTDSKGATSAANPLAPPPRAEEPPSQFEMLNREWMNISQQDNFDGFRLEAANQVTKHLQAAHTLFLGTQMRECGYIYQFGPAFQSEDGRTVLVARGGLDGGVNGRAIQKIGSSTEFKASSMSHLKEAHRCMHEASVEYTGTSWTGATKLAWQGALLLGGSFTQRVTPSLQLGGDLTIVPANLASIGQLGLRWTQGKNIFNTMLSRTPNMKSSMGGNVHELRVQYVRKITDRLSLGSEFKYSHPDKESGLSLAYEYAFRQARVQGNLDADGKVSCSVSDFTGYGFSGMIDYVRGDYKFGVLMQVLPQPEQGQQPM